MAGHQQRIEYPGFPALRWAFGGIALILAMVLGMVALSIHRGYLSHQQQALSQAENLGRLLERNIAALIRQADISLLTVVRQAEGELARGGMDGEALNGTLAYQQSLQPDLLSIRIADAEGVIRFGPGIPDAPVSLAERGFFLRLKADAQAGLVVDGPVLAQISQQWAIVLARRINRPDGSFGGVVYANVAASHFGRLLAQVDLGPRGSASLRTAGLALVSRHPDSAANQNAIGTTTVSDQLKASLEASPLAGAYVAKTSLDQIERANTYRRVENYPLMVIVGLATDDYLADWYREERQIIFLAGLVMLVAAAAARLFFLSWKRQKASEAIIAEMNAELERRVQERTAELAAANTQLEGFVYATSHDLKGPLGRINAFSELLERTQAGRLDGDGASLVAFIRQNAVRLNNLVDDLLEHSRISLQALVLKPIDVGDVVRLALEDAADDIRERGADIRLALAPGTLLADRLHLRRALANLLDNALKYSAEGCPPVIEIGGEPTGVGYRLWVKDRGIGFDMKYQDKVFNLFFRLHSQSEYPGSGVGLSLVKRAVERMGGTVRAESAPGQGTTFFLELQAAPAAS